MRLDLPFLACGLAALAVGIALAFASLRARRSSVLLAAFLCALFGFGLLLQAFAPHLEIEGGKFVVPEKYPGGRLITNPIGIVEKERRMNLWSAVLMSISAAGLVFLYRARNPAVFSGGATPIKAEGREAQRPFR